MPMSAYGPKQTSLVALQMSALEGKADITGTTSAYLSAFVRVQSIGSFLTRLRAI